MLSYAPPEIGEPTALDTFERTSSNVVLELVRSLRNEYDAARNKSLTQEWVDRLNSLNTCLNNLYFVADDWNGYGSPAPSRDSLDTARDILNSFGTETMLPDRILPSADGGVAFLFGSDNDNRAAIETLNEDGPFLLLYDGSGNSATLPWSEEALRRLSEHIQGAPLAAR